VRVLRYKRPSARCPTNRWCGTHYTAKYPKVEPVAVLTAPSERHAPRHLADKIAAWADVQSHARAHKSASSRAGAHRFGVALAQVQAGLIALDDEPIEVAV
jgi:hypothetical protein